MATGGDFHINSKDLDLFARRMKGMRGAFKDMREVHERAARRAEVDVKRRAPMGHRSPKDSRSHKPPGYLKRHIRSKATRSNAYVIADGPGLTYLFLQEFGGKSFWHRQGAGNIRAANRAHRSLESMFGDYKSSQFHFIYSKPRKQRGYFIWNVAYRLRSPLARIYCDGIRDVAAKHGINVKVAADPAFTYYGEPVRRTA